MKSRALILLCLLMGSLMARSFNWAEPRLQIELEPAINRDGISPVMLVKKEENRLLELSLTKEDQRDIQYLLETLTKKDWKWLWKHETQLRKFGECLRKRIHPLRFMEYILKDRQRRRYLMQIRDHTYFKIHIKWREWRTNFAQQMEEMRSKGQLYQYIPDFAKELKLDARVLARFCDESNWDKFLEYCINKT